MSIHDEDLSRHLRDALEIESDAPVQKHLAAANAHLMRAAAVVKRDECEMRRLDRHRTIAVRIADALSTTEDEVSDWLPGEMARSLTERELALMLFCVMKALPEDHAQILIEGILKPAYQVPSASDWDGDAQWWASTASTPEVKAHLRHGVAALSPRDRQRFKTWVAAL